MTTASASSTEEQVILLSAGIAARRLATERERRRLLAGVNWAQLTEILQKRKLLPTLGPRILELAAGSASVEFVSAVERALEMGRRQGAFLQLITLRAIAMLADAGIRSTPLKGPLLSEAIYHDPGRRSSSDIDLLMAPDELQAAVEVVQRMGYEAPTDYVESGGLPLLHFALMHEGRELPPVELHWRIHWYERGFAFERLLTPVVDRSGKWRPSPADELAALLLFYARDGFIDLRLATDLSAWWDAYGDKLPHGALNDLLLAYPRLTRVIFAAVHVAEQVVGLPAAQILGGMPKLDVRQRIAARLANPNPHSSQSQLYADKGLVDGLLIPPGDFGAFLRREVLPPRKVREIQAQRKARRRPRSLLGRGTGLLARYSLTMTRLVRAPLRSR